MAQKFLDKKIIILSHTYFLSFDITPWATNRGTTVYEYQYYRKGRYLIINFTCNTKQMIVISYNSYISAYNY